MNVRFLLLKIRRRFHSRIRVREVVRKAYWLEFENESILNYMAKYNIVTGRYKRPIPMKINTNDLVTTEPGFIIEILETPSS